MIDKQPTPFERLRRVTAERARTEPAAARRRHGDFSSRSLLRALRKKLKTSFVGALARFEGHFGHLWGHGLHESECDADQLAWRAVWEECRVAVLDNGNQQVRAVESEVLQYEVSWNRHHLNLPVQNQNQNENETEEEQ